MVNENLRIRNYYSLEKQLKNKSIFASALPNTLIIEPGAVCSLKCPFCPQSQDDFDLTRGLLKLADFKKIIDYFEDFVDTVLLFNWGEPLLNLQLVEMIEYANERRMRTIVHSNLNFLTEEMAERLVRSGLTELTASIDGASEESYQKYRKGGSFSLALENLKLLLKKKNDLKSNTPRIIWKFLVFRHNEHELDTAKRMAVEMGVPIEFKFAVAPGEYDPSAEKYNNRDFTNKFIENYGLPCEQLWRAPVIHSDGSVLPCCMVSQKKYIVGNIFNQDFKQIWNNDEYQRLRKIVAGETNPEPDTFCYNCIFNPIKRKG